MQTERFSVSKKNDPFGRNRSMPSPYKTGRQSKSTLESEEPDYSRFLHDWYVITRTYSA